MALSDPAALLAFAERLADAARAAIKPHFRQALVADNKRGDGGYDPVTEGDRAAEAAMRALIATHHPDHAVYGEEEGGALSDIVPTWVLDPIDGTRGFLCGLPTWGTLIALDDGRGPVVGVMDQGFTGERFLGAAGRAVLRHGGAERALATRACPRLEDAVLATTSPDLFEDPAEADAFASVRARARMTRYGTDCYAYAMLALGLIDLVIESRLKPYDIQALVPIVEGAGGVITTWSGGSPRHAGQIVAAGDRAVHAQALALLAPAARV